MANPRIGGKGDPPETPQNLTAKESFLLNLRNQIGLAKNLNISQDEVRELVEEVLLSQASNMMPSSEGT